MLEEDFSKPVDVARSTSHDFEDIFVLPTLGKLSVLLFFCLEDLALTPLARNSLQSCAHRLLYLPPLDPFGFDVRLLVFTRRCSLTPRWPSLTLRLLVAQVLKWAVDNGCPWDEEVCAFAAAGGHLEVLQYCWASGCPWNEYTCKFAAEGGHLEALKWCRSKQCPWDEDVCAFAAEEGHMEARICHVW